MKQLNTLKISAFAFLACLFMNSCSTNNEFAKQKYTNFKHSKHPNNTRISSKFNAESIAKKDITLSTSTHHITAPVIAQKTIAVQAPSAQPEATNEQTINVISDKATANATINNKKTVGHVGKFATYRAFKATASALKKSATPAAGDVDLVILVILAIFIPPLAVYLKEGATSRFVLDLILALIGVFGWWFFPFAGLAYLAAIIYALIIVLT